MKVLLLNQSFHPDVVSTAQHASDLATALVAAGHQVTVLASSRGYDNPEITAPSEELWRGVKILRVKSTHFGKASKWRRIVDFGSFWIACLVKLIRLSDYDVVLSLTSPPLISFAGALFAKLRRAKSVAWVMDLNPDEAIAANWLRDNSLFAKILQRLQIYSFEHAEKIIVLDSFMQERVVNKGVAPRKIRVLPPWSHDGAVRFDPVGRVKFRRQHGLTDKFVVMYSGNHSPCHPLDTILRAAKRLSYDPQVAFCFVGGGSEFSKVRRFAEKEHLPNITCLPYQPLETLAASLSAADLHVVVMGDEFAGIVHPCKIYNILRLGVPFLCVGPSDSHIGDITRRVPADVGFMAGHGEVELIVKHIEQAVQASSGSRPQRVPLAIADQYSDKHLVPQMIGVLEEVCSNKFDSNRESSRGSVKDISLNERAS